MTPETHVPIELVQFRLTPEDIQVLLEHRDEWQAADRLERRKIAGKVYSDIKKNSQWIESDRKLKKEVGHLLTMIMITYG